MNLGDLVEHWTLVGAEQDLVAAKHRDTQLGFALLLKFYGRFGRLPSGRVELHDDVVEFVARQLGVDVASLGFYEWTGRTIKRHRAEIRAHSGFRECRSLTGHQLNDHRPLRAAHEDQLIGPWCLGSYQRPHQGGIATTRVQKV